MPLRLNWLPWIETNIFCSRSPMSVCVVPASLFLLNWRQSCHFLVEVVVVGSGVSPRKWCCTPRPLFTEVAVGVARAEAAGERRPSVEGDSWTTSGRGFAWAFAFSCGCCNFSWSTSLPWPFSSGLSRVTRSPKINKPVTQIVEFLKWLADNILPN